MNIPEGFKLVPVVPTAHMIAATVADDQGAKGLRAKIAVDAYNAMLAAAPATPQPIHDEAKERELFEATLGSLMLDRFNDGEYKSIFVEAQWLGWLACAQSRAKAVEETS